MHHRIEAATAAMRSAEAAMSKLVERDRSLLDVNEAACVLQQLRIALDALGSTARGDGAEDGAEVWTEAPAGAGSPPSDSGGQPLPERATEGRPPIDA